MKKHRTIILWASVLLVLSATFLTGCGRHKQRAPSQEQPPIKARLAAAQLQRVPRTEEVVGTVRPRVEASVSSQVMAAIQNVLVNPGDAVKKGNLLAKLDDRALRTEYDLAKIEYERYQSLLAGGAAPQAQFDAAQSRYRLAETALSYANITAPFDGLVKQKLCETGDMATPGKPLFVIEQAAGFRLEASVPERFAGRIALGQTVPVHMDSTGERCDATVSEIVPSADPAARSFLVKLDLQCRLALKSGMFGRALLTVGEREGIFVPPSAIRTRGQLTFVYAVADGRARMRLVKVGRQIDESVEILSGLQAGERVVVHAEGELTDGQLILQ